LVVGAVECRGFRNLVDAHTEIEAGVVVVHGPNAAGKTNLLEAVYFGLTGRSFRAGNDRDLIRHGQEGARVELELARGGSLLAALDRSGERRQLVKRLCCGSALSIGSAGASRVSGDERRPAAGEPHRSL
jgi:recombinational DNA repair ATPase RecF